MFIQIIQGEVRDRDLLQKQLERWRTDVRPGAIGYLGSTGGMTDDGRSVTIARFESQESAQANNDRPEQGAWWAETAPAFAGEPTFHDCAEVDVLMDGGSDQAGFVQIIEGRAKDTAAVRQTGRDMEDDLRAMRPDILGGLVAWHGDGGGFSQVMYFTSEDDARKGETTMADDPRAAEWGTMMEGMPTFIDLRRPEFD